MNLTGIPLRSIPVGYPQRSVYYHQRGRKWKMDNARLTFAPIDLERHADICAQCRADSCRVSFGSDERVYQEHATSPTTVHPDGRGCARYVTWLPAGKDALPGTCVHAPHRASA